MSKNSKYALRKWEFILNKPQNPLRVRVFSFPERIQIMVIYLQLNQVRASKYVFCNTAKSWNHYLKPSIHAEHFSSTYRLQLPLKAADSCGDAGFLLSHGVKLLVLNQARIQMRSMGDLPEKGLNGEWERMILNNLGEDLYTEQRGRILYAWFIGSNLAHADGSHM